MLIGVGTGGARGAIAPPNLTCNLQFSMQSNMLTACTCSLKCKLNTTQQQFKMASSKMQSSLRSFFSDDFQRTTKKQRVENNNETEDEVKKM